MKLRGIPAIALVVLAACWPPSAQAYLGPGLGAGVLASVLGVLAGIGMLVVGIVWYPVKRLIARLRNKHKKPQP